MKEYVEKVNLSHPFLNNNLLPYIGQKGENIKFIDKVINKILKEDKEKNKKLNSENNIENNTYSFIDLFSGSGVVSRYAKLKGFKVWANDLELYAKIISEIPIRYYQEQVEDFFEIVARKLGLVEDDVEKCIILSKQEGFEGFYSLVLKHLNELKQVKYPKNKYFNNFAPQSQEHDNKEEKLFFSKENADRIDAIIEAVFNNRVFSKEAREIVLGSLMVEMLYAVNNPKHITRSFNARLKKSLPLIDLKPFTFLTKTELNGMNKKLLTAENLCQATKMNAELFFNQLSDEEKANIDFVYLDPPFNQQQYSANYSLLISACENDKPIFDGKKFETRQDLNQSNFCRKMKKKGKKLAELSLQKMFDSIQAKYILYSYVPNSVLTISEIINVFSANGNNFIKVEYETSDDLNKIGEKTSHCLFVIEKNKRQYPSEIDFMIRNLKSQSVIPENESFEINQKFINLNALLKETGWKKVSNSVAKKYRVFNKNKLVFEVNYDLMILSNIDMEFDEEEKNIISKFFISEDEKNNIKNQKEVLTDKDISEDKGSYSYLDNVVLPSYDQSLKQRDEERNKTLNEQNKTQDLEALNTDVQLTKEIKGFKFLKHSSISNTKDFDSLDNLAIETTKQKNDNKEKRQYTSLDDLNLTIVSQKDKQNNINETKKDKFNNDNVSLDVLFEKAENKIDKLNDLDKNNLKNELLKMLTK